MLLLEKCYHSCEISPGLKTDKKEFGSHNLLKLQVGSFDTPIKTFLKRIQNIEKLLLFFLHRQARVRWPFQPLTTEQGEAE